MKQVVKKLLSGALAGCILLSLSACGGKAPDTQKPSETADANEPNPNTQYTINMVQYTNWPVDNEGDLLQKWNKKFNVKLNVTNLDSKNAQEQLNLKIAAGDTPDVFTVNSIALNNYQRQGALAEISDAMLQKYMPICLKKLETEAPEAMKFGLMDGKRYGLMNSVNWMSSFRTPIVYNGVWMKKLGIGKTPETLAELEDLLYKFTNNDPDGNGKKDTYGLSDTGLNAVYGAYMTNPGMWLEKNGQVVYSTIQPEMKQALATLNKWYKDGILDPQFITGENTGGYSMLTQAFINSRIGLSCMGSFYHWSPALPGRQIGEDKAELDKTNVELSNNLVFGQPIKGPSGKGAIQQASLLGDSYLVFGSQLSGQPGKMAKILQVIEGLNSSVDTYLDYFYGNKGQDWDYDATGALKQNVTSDALIKRGGWGTLRLIILMQNAVAPQKKVEEWAKQQGFDKGGFTTALPGFVVIPSQAQYNADLTKLEKTTLISIITGDKPISYFDTFVSEWKSRGGDQISKEVNDWYKTRK